MRISYVAELGFYLVVWFFCNVASGGLTRELLYDHDFSFPVYITLCQALARIGVSHVAYGWVSVCYQRPLKWIGWKDVGRLMIPTAMFYVWEMMMSYGTVMDENFRAYQMVRLSDPVFVLVGLCILGQEKVNAAGIACMALVLYGAFVGTFVSGSVSGLSFTKMTINCMLGAGSTVMTGTILRHFDPFVLHFYVSIISTIIIAVCFFVDDFWMGLQENAVSLPYFRIGWLLFLLIGAWVIRVIIGTVFQLRSSSVAFSMSITFLNVLSYTWFLARDHSGTNIWSVAGILMEVAGIAGYNVVRYRQTRARISVQIV